MTPEREAELRAEFEQKYGRQPHCDSDKGGGSLAYDRWALKLSGWLQAHEDSEMAKDAGRYRWLRDCCRSSGEHWGGRWSIIVDGPVPKTHNDSDDFDAAIDSAIKDTQ